MADSHPLPHVLPVASPALDAFAAVGIRLNGPAQGVVGETCVVSGCFIVPPAEAEARGGAPHRDLVLQVLRDSQYESVHLLRNHAVFADDLQELQAGLRGWFTFDLWQHTQLKMPGVYFLRVSLGEWLSAPLQIAIAAAGGATPSPLLNS